MASSTGPLVEITDEAPWSRLSIFNADDKPSENIASRDSRAFEDPQEALGRTRRIDRDGVVLPSLYYSTNITRLPRYRQVGGQAFLAMPNQTATGLMPNIRELRAGVELEGRYSLELILRPVQKYPQVIAIYPHLPANRIFVLFL